MSPYADLYFKTYRKEVRKCGKTERIFRVRAVILAAMVRLAPVWWLQQDFLSVWVGSSKMWSITSMRPGRKGRQTVEAWGVLYLGEHTA